MAVVTRFVTVVQRCPLRAEEELFNQLENLYRIETHMSMIERSQLFQTAMQCPKGFIACEIGSFLGASASFLATAAKLRGGRVHCVDAWDNRAMSAEVARDTYSEFLYNIAPLHDFVTIHRGESIAVAPQVPEALDLLFIDGDHSYEATLADLRAYAPKLKSSALLTLHDFARESVRRACAEYLVTRPADPVASAGSLQVFRMK